MKRIILVGLVGITLLGCGEKKVTEAMLEGEWECTRTEQYVKWKNGAFQDVGEVSTGKFLVTYKFVDGLLMKKGENNIRSRSNWWHSVSATVALQNLMSLRITNNEKIYSSSKYEYISDKEYKQSDIIDYIFPNKSEEEQERDNSRHKFEENCIKVVN